MARKHQTSRGSKNPASNVQHDGFEQKRKKKLEYLADVLNCGIEEVEQALRQVGSSRHQIEKYIRKRKGSTGRPRS